MDAFKQAVVDFLGTVTNLDHNLIESKLEVPPDQNLGDFAFPCFLLAKELQQAPPVIAQNLAQKFKATKLLKEVHATGPYLNFFLNNTAKTGSILSSIQSEKEQYGKGSQGEKYVLEFPAPNTNKPLHLGHVRLMIYGCALSNLLNKAGNTAINVNLLNDRGIHICKSMLAYKKWGADETPESTGLKPDYLVGKYYVKYSQMLEAHPEIEQEAQAMLQQWEDGDPDVRAIWKRMNSWAIEGMNESFKTFDFQSEKDYFESAIYLDGKKIVEDGLAKGIFHKDEKGNIAVNLEEYNLNSKVLLRADGTTVYSTQDIALAHHKQKDFKADHSLYLVGTEQNFYLEQMFKVFELLGIKGKCAHAKSGMVYLPTGRMKSREGTVVEADGLVEDVVALAKNALIERYPDLDDTEREKRAFVIGMGALRFFFLKYDPARDFTFNTQESLSFDGETGPYVQYTHARICSILRKSELELSACDASLLIEPEEKAVLTLLDSYGAIVQDAAKHFNTSKITRYLLDISQAFNEFYHKHKVNTDNVQLSQSRLVLCDCTRIVLKDAMAILNIVAPEVM